MCLQYSSAVYNLSHDEPKWHFNALDADPEQLADFRIEDMAATVRAREPKLWSLVMAMLTGTGVGISRNAEEDLDGDVLDES